MHNSEMIVAPRKQIDNNNYTVSKMNIKCLLATTTQFIYMTTIRWQRRLPLKMDYGNGFEDCATISRRS